MDDRELEWDSDSNSTASDLSGPGRNYDNLVGYWGRRLELRINGAQRPPRPPLPPPPRLSQVSFITDSDAATIPDNPGPGYLVNKVLTRGSAHLERAVTWFSRRVGSGPYGPIDAIMNAVYLELRKFRPSVQCTWGDCGRIYVPELAKPPSNRSLPDALEWILYIIKWIPRCPACGATEEDIKPDDWISHVPVPSRPVKQLAGMLKSSNPSSRDISLQFLTVLATSLPSGRSTPAEDAVRRLYVSALNALGVDHLLAPCRRVLAVYYDSDLLQLHRNLRDFYYRRASRTRLMLDTHEVQNRVASYCRHPETQALTLTMLGRVSFADQYEAYLAQQILPTLWLDAATSTDTVQIAVISDFLDSVYIRGIFADDLGVIFDVLVRFLIEQPHIASCLPERLKTLAQEEVPSFCEAIAIRDEDWNGRRVDEWRRALWRYDPDHPDGERGNDGHLFKRAARQDGRLGYAKVDAVWYTAPIWDRCNRHRSFLREARRRATAAGAEVHGRYESHEYRDKRQPRSMSMQEFDWKESTFRHVRVFNIPGWSRPDRFTSDAGAMNKCKHDIQSWRRKRSYSL